MTPTTTSSLAYRTQSRFGHFPLFRRTLLPALLLLLALTARGQTTRFVSTTGTNTNPASATSWATSTTNLQGAIDAGAGEVWVAAGIYKPGGNANTNRSSSFVMKNGVTIYGGFVGNETALSSRPPINPNAGNPSSTTLSGEIGDPTSTTDNSLHVISNPSGLNSTARLDGVVITGGNANGSSCPDYCGGAIYNFDNSSPSLTNCSFINNTAHEGGAIYNLVSSPSLTNCNFLNNTAFAGGAIFNNTGSTSVTNCSFLNNTANYGGAAIYNNSGSPSLTNCSFLNNNGGFGGAMFNNYGRQSVTNCSFLNNSIYNYYSVPGNPSLTNCVLFGAGIGNANSTPTASYCLFDAAVTGYTSVTGNLTTTTSPFVSTASVALNACAPAINAGDPSSATAATGPFSVTALPQTDLAGNPRIFGGRVDMGAVEFQGPGLGFTVSVSANPGFTITSGQTVTLTASGGMSYTWTGNVQSATFTAAPTSTATYAVTGVNAAGCRSQTSVTVTVIPLPSITNFRPTAATVCAGSVATFTATLGNVSGTYNFTLTNGTGPVSGTGTGTPFSQTIITAGSGIQTFTLTIGASGTTVASSNTLNVGNHPDYAALVDLYNSTNGPGWTDKTGWLSNCDPCNGWFGVNCDGGRVVTLNLENNQLAGTIPASLSALNNLLNLFLNTNQLTGSIPASLSALTSLQWLVLNTNQLTGSLPASLSALTNLQRIYLNNNQLTGSIPSGLSSLTNLSEFKIQNNQLSGCFPASLTFMCGRTTDFSSNTGLPGGGDFEAFCNTGAGSDAFVALATAGQSTATVGTAVSLSVNGGSTGTFSWLAPAGAVLGSPATTSSVSATLTTPGEKTFTVTVSFGTSCSSVATVSVNALPTPTLAGFAATTTAICRGSVATFTATVGNVSGTYNFTLTNGSSPVSGTATGAAFSQTLTAGVAGAFDFTLTIGANGTTVATSNTLTVNATPNAGINVPANLTVTCSAPTITLTATGGGTYRWENTTNTASRTINASGVYSVTVTNAASCTAATSQSVTVVQNSTPPSLTVTANPGFTITSGQAITLTASGGSSYTWTGGTTGSSFTASPGIGSSIYSVTGINAAGCSSTTSVTVTVNALPAPTIAGFAATAGTICAGSVATFTATLGNVSGTYAFTLTNGTGPISGTATGAAFSQTLTTAGSGVQTYTLTIGANGTTIAASNTLTLNTLVSATLTASSLTLTCAQANVTLTATPAGLGNYRFSGPGLSQNGPANTAPASQAGVYSVTAGTGGCASVASVTLTGAAGPFPSALLLGSGNLSCTTPTLTLTAVGGSSYVFSGPGIMSQTDGRQRIIVGDYVIFTTPIPTQGTAVVSKPGLYTVLVTGPTGCTSTASILVTGTECR